MFTQPLTLPGYTLKAHVFDGVCKPDYASRQGIVYLASSNKSLGSVGMACSVVCAHVAPILSALKSPSVVIGCNDGTLDDADLFPHFLHEIFDGLAEYFAAQWESGRHHLDISFGGRGRHCEAGDRAWMFLRS